MYLPIQFREPETAKLLQLMRTYPFATVVTQANGESFVNHLPILTETRESGEILLRGHMAKGNPQWRQMKEGNTLVVFHGPHAYITPQWYRDPMNVPTWNYAVVHASGPAHLLQDFAGIEAILQKTVEAFESAESQPWRYELPQDFREDLARAIVGFEIEVTRLEGKFKLSQNRSPEDRAGVIEGLKGRGDEMSRKVLELMTP